MSTPIKKTENDFPSIFSDLFDTDRFFGNNWGKSLNANFPAANVKETDKEYRIEVSIPGLKKEDIKVNIENEILSISAENKDEKNEEGEKYTRKEFSYNSFSRSFQLPKIANTEKTDASYENGILKVVINKKEEASKDTKKHISIN